jgi:hypothetical protein
MIRIVNAHEAKTHFAKLLEQDVSLLLDTHVVLWWFTDDPRLSTRARDAI